MTAQMDLQAGGSVGFEEIAIDGFGPDDGFGADDGGLRAMTEPDARGLRRHGDGMARCGWCGEAEDYVAYHDFEWGRPVADDIRLFEKISLEGFQSGLSWLTILRKRAHFRAAFDGFDFDLVADYGPEDAARLLTDAGIVRHAKKIESVINNAKRAREMRDAYGSLAAYFWRFEPDASERPSELTAETAPSTTPTATRLSKDLKKLGWSFVGPTTAYAFSQAMGLVNDHYHGCFLRDVVEAERSAFRRPC